MSPSYKVPLLDISFSSKSKHIQIYPYYYDISIFLVFLYRYLVYKVVWFFSPCIWGSADTRHCIPRHTVRHFIINVLQTNYYYYYYRPDLLLTKLQLFINCNLVLWTNHILYFLVLCYYKFSVHYITFNSKGNKHTHRPSPPPLHMCVLCSCSLTRVLHTHTHIMNYEYFNKRKPSVRISVAGRCTKLSNLNQKK